MFSAGVVCCLADIENTPHRSGIAISEICRHGAFSEKG